MSSLRASFSEKKEEQRREKEGMRAMEMHFSSHHDATGHDACAAGDDDRLSAVGTREASEHGTPPGELPGG